MYEAHRRKEQCIRTIFPIYLGVNRLLFATVLAVPRALLCNMLQIPTYSYPYLNTSKTSIKLTLFVLCEAYALRHKTIANLQKINNLLQREHLVGYGFGGGERSIAFEINLVDASVFCANDVGVEVVANHYGIFALATCFA